MIKTQALQMNKNVTKLFLFGFIEGIYLPLKKKKKIYTTFYLLNLLSHHIQPLHPISIAKYLLYPERQKLSNLVKIQLQVGEGGSFGP